MPSRTIKALLLAWLVSGIFVVVGHFGEPVLVGWHLRPPIPALLMFLILSYGYQKKLLTLRSFGFAALISAANFGCFSLAVTFSNYYHVLAISVASIIGAAFTILGLWLFWRIRFTSKLQVVLAVVLPGLSGIPFLVGENSLFSLFGLLFNPPIWWTLFVAGLLLGLIPGIANKSLKWDRPNRAAP